MMLNSFSGTFRALAKVCGQERQDSRLEPRRCQNAAGFNSKGFGVRFTGPGAYRCDVLQLRLCERSTETHLSFRTPLLWKPGLC